MAGSVNKAIIVGNLGRDPETRRSCERCGKSILQMPRRSATQHKEQRFCSKRCAGLRRRASDYEVVSQYENGHSSTEIGATLGISAAQILRILKANGVATRGASENKRLSHSRPEVIEKMRAASSGRTHSEESKDKLRARYGPANAQWRSGLTISKQGYLHFTTSPANGVNAGRAVHQVIAEWAAGRQIEVGEHVHHLDGNKLNNQPSNLVILSASDHAKIHSLDRLKGRRRAC